MLLLAQRLERLGHSRKQFVDILQQKYGVIGRYQVISVLLWMLRLYFYVTCDKSTPSRISNQAILLCTMVDGSREAIAVSTEEVYESNNTVFSGDVSSATARELPLKVFSKVKRA